ncbi:MAG: FkbM family methyltransferase [Chthoniobacteraceae bacterium]
MTESPLTHFAQRAYETIVPHRIRKGIHNRRWVHNRDKWEAIRGTPKSLTRSLGGGVRLKLYGDSRLCEMLYFDQFEPETRCFLDAYLRSGDVFLDIGANVGLYTIAAARIVGIGGEVHAFEPCSQTFSRLEENVRLNALRSVSCHRLALSDTNAEAKLSIAKDGFDAWNSLGKPYMGEDGGQETVQTATLDSFVSQHRLENRITAMKIDVEGWENQVLAGAEKLLSAPNAPALCIEFTEQAAQLAGSSCAALYHTLERFGFQMFTVGDTPETVVPFALRDPFPNVNLLALKDPAAARARFRSSSKR